MSKDHPTDTAESENETSPVGLAAMRDRVRKIWLSPRNVLKLREQYAADVTACLREIERLRGCLQEARKDAPCFPTQNARKDGPRVPTQGKRVERAVPATRTRDTKANYLSVKQVHQRLNGAVSLRGIYKYCYSGRLHYTKAFGKVLVLEASLEALLKEGEPDFGDREDEAAGGES
jgi:hypothetical protein